MKKQWIVYLAAVAVCGLVAAPVNTALAQVDAAPRTFCRFVPERSDDFAWENDKVAFRAYGPALRSDAENGGVDCWLKRVDYPIINKWYKENTYHTDHGEGNDPYHVGSSLGCGGIGLWLDGKLATSETFVSWKVIKCEPEESVFELDYVWEYEGHKYTETKLCSIRLGDRLFHTVATFSKDGEPAASLPVAIGITTHDGKARTTIDVKKGWLVCWEEIEDSDLGTGVVMDPKRIEQYKPLKSDTPDASHALFISKTDDRGRIDWWAGYGWEKAGEIMSVGEWKNYLTDFAKKHE